MSFKKRFQKMKKPLVFFFLTLVTLITFTTLIKLVFENAHMSRIAEEKIASEEYFVQPVILFPTDYPVDQEVVARANVVINEIRSYYAAKNDGKTFKLEPIKTIVGDHDSKWYWCNDGETGCNPGDSEGNIIRQINEKGITIEPSPPNVIYSIVFMGGGGWAGASGELGATRGLRTFIGDLSIYPELDKNCNRVKQYYFKGDPVDSLARCKNENMPNTRQGSGAWAHELGHAFNLPHPDDTNRPPAYPPSSSEFQNSIMGNQSVFPNGRFTQKEKDILASSPFFSGTANGATNTPTQNQGGEISGTITVLTSNTPTKVIVTIKDVAMVVPVLKGTGDTWTYKTPLKLPTGTYAITATATINSADVSSTKSFTLSSENLTNADITITGWTKDIVSEKCGQGGVDSEKLNSGFLYTACLADTPTTKAQADTGKFDGEKAKLLRANNPFCGKTAFDVYQCKDGTVQTINTGTVICNTLPWCPEVSGTPVATIIPGQPEPSPNYSLRCSGPEDGSGQHFCSTNKNCSDAPGGASLWIYKNDPGTAYGSSNGEKGADDACKEHFAGTAKSANTYCCMRR